MQGPPETRGSSLPTGYRLQATGTQTLTLPFLSSLLRKQESRNPTKYGNGPQGRSTVTPMTYSYKRSAPGRATAKLRTYSSISNLAKTLTY